MTVRIYKPSKTAMQSGEAGTRAWVLEHEPAAPRQVEPLMGWTAGSDTRAQVKLHFDTKEQAIAYAERNGLAYTLIEPNARKPIRKSYSENFRYGRARPWTH